MDHKPHRIAAVAAGLLLALTAAPAAAGSFVVDLRNVASQGEKDGADNTVLAFSLGAGAYVSGFSWDVDVTAFEPSWLSELTLNFGNSSGVGVSFAPLETDAAGNATASGSLDLVNNGLAFTLKPDGKLQLEFHDSFDDIAGAADGRWNRASFSFEFTPAVPEPASFATLGLGLAAIAALGARRRRAA
jgi:hypothetical protein